MENEKRPGPTTSLMGTDGKVPDSKYGNGNNNLSGPGGIVLIIIVVLAVIAGIANSLGWLH